MMGKNTCAYCEFPADSIGLSGVLVCHKLPVMLELDTFIDVWFHIECFTLAVHQMFSEGVR